MVDVAGLLAVEEVLDEITIHCGDFGAEATEVQKAIVDRGKQAHV